MANRHIGKLDEQAVIRCYEEYETARVVAERFDVSDETIYRVLKKHGIQRTHRHDAEHQPKNTRPNNCGTKYCPVIVVMLRTVLKLRHKEIVAATGFPSSAVGNIIARRGLSDKSHNLKVDKDAIERDYLAGVSTYEMAEKYCVDHSTISKWMKKRGHHRGKGYPCGKKQHGTNKGHETQRSIAIERVSARAMRESGGTVELVEFCGKKSVFKCHVCGERFTRTHKAHFTCPQCEERQSVLDRERVKQEHEHERKLERERELAKDKVCPSCGAVFHSEYDTKKYCSDTCKKREDGRRNNTSSHRKRARIHGVEYEPGITLEKLIERDGNICQICGEPCDINDKRYGQIGPLYPSRDHIIPIAKGGSHTWDNVQLAHMMCNSKKRDLLDYTAKVVSA